MNTNCKICEHEELCKAIFGQKSSNLCGIASTGFSNIEYAIDDIYDILQFGKFLTEIFSSKFIPEEYKPKIASLSGTFSKILSTLINEPATMTVFKVNALENLISEFDKGAFNFFNLPKWFTDSEEGIEILQRIELSPNELEQSDLLFKEYQRQYEKDNK